MTQPNAIQQSNIPGLAIGDRSATAPNNGPTPNLLANPTRLFINAQDYGAIGDGVTDDTAALQAAISATAPGGLCYLPRTPAGYLISQTLVVPSGVAFASTMGRGGSGYPSSNTTPAVIRAASGSNLDALIASIAWANNLGGIDGYIDIHDLILDPNTSNQTGGQGHGVALASWRSNVERCTILTAGGAPITIGTRTRNGSFAAGNAIENHVEENITYGGTACIQTRGVLATDNWICRNVCVGLNAGTTSGIQLADNGGAGSVVDANHVYNCATPIAGSNVSLIAVTNNYLEPSNAATGSGWTAAISFNVIGDDVIIANNRILVPTSAVSGTTFFGVILTFATAGPYKGVAVTGNTITGGAGSQGSLIWVGANASCYGSVTIAGNALDPANSINTITNSTPAQVTLSQTAPVVKTGTATLVAGAVTVADTNTTAGTNVRLMTQTIGGTPGALYVAAKTAGTSFQIKSTSGSDTSTVYYEIANY